MVTPRVGRVGVVVLALGAALGGGGAPAAAVTGTVGYSPSSQWHPCADDGELQCRTVLVPRDWNRPEGQTIPVTGRRLPALAPGRPAVVMNFGGPGEDGSALSLFADNALRRHFDLVSWDPRGAGSPPDLATCDSAVMSRWQPRTGPFAWSAVARQAVRARAGVNQACVAANPRAMRLVGTNQVVRDLEAIRAAIGGRLTYVGFSYGTRLGRLYAQKFPEQVRAMVLDGVTGPSARTDAYLRSSRIGGEAAWRWVNDRVSSDVRALGHQVDDVLSERTVMIDDVDSDRWGRWWQLKSTLRSSRAVDSATANTCQWAQAAGLPTPACPPAAVAGSALQAAVTLVDCADLSGRLTPGQIGDALSGGPIAGPAAMNVLDYTTMCAGVPEPTDPIPPPRSTRLRTAPLLINGVADPSTPLYSAERTRKYFPGSRLVRVDTSVHGLFLFNRNTCVDAVATRYLRRLVLPARGSTCPAA